MSHLLPQQWQLRLTRVIFVLRLRHAHKSGRGRLGRTTSASHRRDSVQRQPHQQAPGREALYR